MPDDRPEEVPVEVVPDAETQASESEPQDSKTELDATDQVPDPAAQLEEERRRSAYYEDQFKRALADFQNLKRKIQNDVENEVSNRFNRFMLELLEIVDDFERAKDAYERSKADTAGLDSIIRNIHALLSRHRVVPIEALGNKFNPNLHEAISFLDDEKVEENTITRELRKGYISSDRVIRPTLVEISRKSE